jgi:hypothetical protein
MVLLYQIFTVMANPVFQHFRYNAHIPGCLPAKYKGAFFFRIVFKNLHQNRTPYGHEYGLSQASGSNAPPAVHPATAGL